MPHLILEHSRDIAPGDAVRDALVRIHEAATASGIMQAIDTKVRAVPIDIYLVAGRPAPFAHLSARLLEGRPPETKLMLSKALLAALEASFPQVERLSVEVQDMDAFSYKKRPYADILPD